MQRVPLELTANARSLRREATTAERALWQALRGKPRFTRQLVVSHFIIDIAFRSLKIAVELDGGHRGSHVEEHAERTDYLERHGWTVLRFWNTEVLQNLDGVMVAISLAVSRASTHPRPLPYREGR